MKNNYPTSPAPEPAAAPSFKIKGRHYTAYEGAILFHADGRIEAVAPQHGKVFTYPELKGFVGGYIEVLPFHGSQRWLVINEQGKLHGLPRNDGATMIARANGLPASDYIAGPALLCLLDQMD